MGMGGHKQLGEIQIIKNNMRACFTLYEGKGGGGGKHKVKHIMRGGGVGEI